MNNNKPLTAIQRVVQTATQLREDIHALQECVETIRSKKDAGEKITELEEAMLRPSRLRKLELQLTDVEELTQSLESWVLLLQTYAEEEPKLGEDYSFFKSDLRKGWCMYQYKATMYSNGEIVDSHVAIVYVREPEIIDKVLEFWGGFSNGPDSRWTYEKLGLIP